MCLYPASITAITVVIRGAIIFVLCELHLLDSSRHPPSCPPSRGMFILLPSAPHLAAGHLPVCIRSLRLRFIFGRSSLRLLHPAGVHSFTPAVIRLRPEFIPFISSIQPVGICSLRLRFAFGQSSFPSSPALPWFVFFLHVYCFVGFVWSSAPPTSLGTPYVYSYECHLVSIWHLESAHW